MWHVLTAPIRYLRKHRSTRRASLDGTKRSVESNERSSTAVYRDWPSNEEPKLKRTHAHYQSQRTKEVHEHHRVHGRRLSFQEGDRPKMVTQDLKVGEEVVTGDEPPPPPQPPYHLPSRQIDETRAARTDRERRSSRKLTKDSGYETSQYAESDYANVDWDQASDRSPTSKSNRSPSSDWGNASDHEFAASPPPPAYHDRSHGRSPDAWRGVYTRTNSTKSSYQTTGTHQSTWEPVSTWGRQEVTSVRAVPVHYSSRRTASSVATSRRSAAPESIGRYSSTDSLASGSSSCVSFPPSGSSGVTGAKSTPSLHVNSEDVARRSYRARAASASHMSNSTPNLEREKEEAKVTARGPKSASYNPQPCGVYPTPTGRSSRWHEEDPEGMQTMGPYQHSRQVSSQSSSGSERTSSSYSQHSRQVSSQSSFSEEDFRIQRIKEEFHQCMTYVQDYFPPPPPPYPMRYYSSEGLIYSQEVARWEQRLNPSVEVEVDNDVDSGKGSASPPPPPVRDASSLKYSSRQATTGHEKFSSWPADGENRSAKYDSYYYNKKERPPSYEDGPPPPYSPYWTRAEPQDDHEAGTDTTATPLMDRLRQDAQQTTWNGKEENAAHNYNGRESVTSSTSSQETLKWHGSTSDLSVQSERTRSATTGAVVPVTVHSARVKPPQRHQSESVLYYGNPENEFPVRCVEHPNSSWAEQVRKNNATNVASTGKRLLPPPHANSFASPRSQAVANEEIRTLLTPEFAKPLMSVAQRIQDLERLQARANTNCAFKKSGHEDESGDRALYLDPAKKHRVSDPELKAIQKQAVRSFFERQTGVQQRRHSSSSRSSQSLPRNCYPLDEKNGGLVSRPHRVVDVKVAIYYNTYTQTLVSGDEALLVRDRRASGGHFASTPSPPTLREVRDDGQRPRKDIALQTEWIAPSRSPCKDQKSTTKDGEIKNRENSTSCRPDAKNARPPERPPKRPHLNRSTPREETPPPPPLLPRAGASASASVSASGATLASARAALVIPNDEDVEDQELLSIEESARQLRNLEPPPGVERPPPPSLEGERGGDLSRGSTPELPLPPPPPPVRTDEVVESDEPLPPPPTPNEVKRIIKSSSMSEGNDQIVSHSLIYPKDSYMSYRSERQPARHGFDGNYHRTSPEMINTDMETNQLPNLSPTAWEKKHNIGLRGTTVVYKSTDIKAASAQKPYMPVRAASDELTNGMLNEHRGKLVSTHEKTTKEKNEMRNDDWRYASECSLEARVNGNSPLRSSIASSTTSSTVSSLDGLESPPPSLGSKQGLLEDGGMLEQHKGHQEMTTQTTPSVNKVGQTWRQQEVECELLSKDLAQQLPEEEKALQALLVPCQLKTTADYMQGLFEVSTASRRSANRARLNPGSSPPFAAEIAKRSLQKAVLPADSSYYTTSESKARFLTRYSKDVKQAKNMEDDTMDVGKKKEDLVTSIGRKLEILRTEQLIIQEEISANQELGRSVTNRVEKLAKSNEYEKFKLHVEEIDKITSLLLGLSGRLARAENALMDLADESSKEDREVIKAKRDKLFEQHEEAKRLKENIDRRSLQVSNFLHNYLSSEEYADYDHFIKMKSKLLIDSREIDDKIKLGEEQMMALKNNLGNSPL